MLTYFLLNFAQRINPGEVGIKELTGEEVLTNTLNIVYFTAGFVAVIVLIFGAVMYSGSGGSASAVTRAKGLITYSVIGLVVVLAAFMITNFIRGSF